VLGGLEFLLGKEKKGKRERERKQNTSMKTVTQSFPEHTFNRENSFPKTITK